MAGLTREQVHEALRCLYNNVDLCRSDLAAAFPEAGAGSVEERALSLRALLLQAIEALRPPRRYPFGSLESRSYDVLTLRYVEDLPVGQLAEELSLSERQVHRDLWRAEERLSAVLGSQAPPAAGDGDEPNVFEDELQYLRSQPTRVRLDEVLRSAVELVAPLAAQLGTAVEVEPCEAVALVAADPAVLKQVLAQLLSGVAQSAAGEVSACVLEEAQAASVRLRFRLRDRGLLARQLEGVKRIADSQGYEIGLECDPQGVAEVGVRLRSGAPPSILIVEDNPGSVELYRRYLSASNWQIHTVPDPRAALSLAGQLRPDVIVLDIMMPKMDGWTVLKALATHDETRGIPVLVCSVVQDERLAGALGARAQLHKPVSRGQFLAAIRQCLREE